MNENNDALWRPRLHFTPRKGWMNDPCGLVYWSGEYHLFYQYNPDSTHWGSIHWGHAVSSDLFGWRELPIALQPDRDNGMVFTGSTVFDRQNRSGLFNGSGGLVALYTGALEDTKLDHLVESQCLAYSVDAYNWSKLHGSAVLPNNGSRNFRDPKAFYHEPTDRWIMVLAVGNEVRFYGSQDLRSWQYLSAFGAELGNHDGVWECPDMLYLPVRNGRGEGRWVLVIHVGKDLSPEYAGAQYFVGHFDGESFQAHQRGQWVDAGHDFYAAQSWANLPAEGERTIWIAWASHWAYSHDTPTEQWRGVLTLPRQLELVKACNQFVLAQSPVQELQALRQQSIAGHLIQNNSSATMQFSIQQDEAVDLLVQPPVGSSIRIELNFGFGRLLLVELNGSTGGVTVDRGKLGMERYSGSFHPRSYAEPVLSSDEVPGGDIRIIWDRSIIEVFARGGILVFTDLVFAPTPLCKIRVKTLGNTEPAQVFLYELKKTGAKPKSKEV